MSLACGNAKVAGDIVGGIASSRRSPEWSGGVEKILSGPWTKRGVAQKMLVRHGNEIVLDGLLD